jgi:hypothetical protein
MITLVCPEHGVHQWLPRTARYLWKLEIDKETAFAELRAACNKVQHRRLPDSEINHFIALVYGQDGQSGTSARHQPKYDPDYLQTRAGRIGEEITDDYLEARSQFTCHNRTPAGFLHKLYKPGENVWITTNTKSLDGEIWTHAGNSQRFDELKHLVEGHAAGVWFLICPIDSSLHAIERRKSSQNPQGHSFSVIEAVTAWRYWMIETDVAPCELWRKALVQVRLPIVAIYHSGKRGDHALVRLDAKSKAHWEELVARYENELTRLGACSSSFTARRLSRLPNCMRGETGQNQKLLYLCPDADSTPIYQRPVREPPEAVFERVRESRAAYTPYEDFDL